MQFEVKEQREREKEGEREREREIHAVIPFPYLNVLVQQFSSYSKKIK